MCVCVCVCVCVYIYIYIINKLELYFYLFLFLFYLFIFGGVAQLSLHPCPHHCHAYSIVNCINFLKVDIYIGSNRR